MRKIIYLTSAILLLLFSQKVFAQNFRFGLKASPLLTWMKSDDKSVSTSNIKGGFNYGLTFEYFLTENYGASSGITITHKGGNNLGYGSPQYTDSTYLRFNIKEGEETRLDSFRRPEVSHSLQYLEIPLTLKLKTNEIGYMTYFGQFGIAPGINISSNADIVEDISSNSKNAVDANLIKETKVFNLALHVGAGFEYNLGGNTSFVLGLYFNNGFTDVTKYDQNKVILNHLALRLGVLF